jgi:hypothetical protein
MPIVQNAYRDVHELVCNVATVRLFKMTNDSLEVGFVFGLCTTFGLVDMENSAEIVDVGRISEGVTFC